MSGLDLIFVASVVVTLAVVWTACIRAQRRHGGPL
jgi:hypothetical protein